VSVVWVDALVCQIQVEVILGSRPGVSGSKPGVFGSKPGVFGLRPVALVHLDHLVARPGAFD